MAGRPSLDARRDLFPQERPWRPPPDPTRQPTPAIPDPQPYTPSAVSIIPQSSSRSGPPIQRRAETLAWRTGRLAQQVGGSPGPHPASAATAFEVLSGRPAVPTAGAPWSPPASNSGITVRAAPPGRSGRSRTSRWSSPGRSREPNFLPKTQVLCTAAPPHRRTGPGPDHDRTTAHRSTASPRHRVTAPSARPPDRGRPPDHRASLHRGHHGHHAPRTSRPPRRALRHGRHEALPLRDSAPAAPVAQTGDWRFSAGAPALLRLCALERRPRGRRRGQSGRQRACRAGPAGPDQLRARTQVRRRIRSPTPSCCSCTSASNDPGSFGQCPRSAATVFGDRLDPRTRPVQRMPRGPPAGDPPAARCRPGSDGGPESRPHALSASRRPPTSPRAGVGEVGKAAQPHGTCRRPRSVDGT